MHAFEVLDRNAGEYRGWFAERSEALSRVARWLKSCPFPAEASAGRGADATLSTPKMWFTTREAAEYLRITPGALLKHVERGKVRPDNASARGRVSGHRFRRATLDAFLTGAVPA